MIAVYQAGNLLEAQLVKGALESNGVTAFIAGEHFLPMMGHLQVMVDEDEAEHARQVVAEIRAAETPAPEPEEPEPEPEPRFELAPRPI